MAMALSPPWLWRNNNRSSKGEEKEESKGNRRFKARATASAAKSSRRGGKRRTSSSSSTSRAAGTRSPPWIDARQVEEEFDMVVVPADGGCCLSGTESDDSDWSVGWMEPHSADFTSDSEDSFAVLVPCYGSSSPRLVATASNPPAVWAAALLFSSSSRNAAAEQRKYVEEWLASLEEEKR